MQWVWGVGAIGVRDVGGIYTQEVPINMSLELSTISQIKDIRGVYKKLFKGGLQFIFLVGASHTRKSLHITRKP